MQQPPAGENAATLEAQPPHIVSSLEHFEVSGGLDTSSQTPIQQQQQQQRRTGGAAIFKVVVVYCLLLAVRHLVHGDAAYFSADLIVKVVKLLMPLLRSLTGYTPTIIYVLEAIAILPCAYVGFMFARRLIGVNGRVALMQYAFLLFVVAPAVFVASTHFRNSWCGGDPHKRPDPSTPSTSVPSVDDSSSYISPLVIRGSSGELVMCNEDVCVEDVPEEEYQSTKSGDSPPPSSRPKPRKPSKTTAVTAVDLKHGQDARVYSVMKDLGKHQFLVFCALGVIFSSVASYILVRLIDA